MRTNTNLRAALIAGLAHGLERRTLIVQLEHKPAPLDYRDFIETVRTRFETQSAVEKFCAEVLVENQRVPAAPAIGRQSPLSEIDLGRSAAENEEETLEQYFVKTAQYVRISRSPSSIVIGRKGSGKSAIFTKILQERVRDKRSLLVDLRPASHNLSELREEIVDIVNVGVFDHTITAFCEYIIYMEIVHRYRDRVLNRWKNSTRIYQSLAEIERTLNIDEMSASGDFASRLDQLVKAIIEEIRDKGHSDPEKITNIVFREQIPVVRDVVTRSVSEYDEVVVIFDNIDKGWPATKLDANDVRIVRLLFEALHKIQRELTRRDVRFQFVVTLRNDVYEMLVEQTPDRGKYNSVSVDWSDREQLRNLIVERLSWAVGSNKVADMWDAIFPAMVGTPDTFDFLVDRSLFRPRFLIDLIERIISYAVNRGHAAVTDADIADGIKDNSIYLVGYLGYEVRDVAGVDEDLFYEFIGKGTLLTKEEIVEILRSRVPDKELAKIFDILLWYGFIGIASDEGERYIYDYNYDSRRMLAAVARAGKDVLFAVNPAFVAGLN